MQEELNAGNDLDCRVLGKKRSGKCVFTRKENVEVNRILFNGKPMTVATKQLQNFLDYKADELGIDIYVEDDNEIDVEIFDAQETA